MLKNETNLMLQSLMKNKKAFKKNFVKSIFPKISQSSYRNLLKQDVRFISQTTIDKLYETRNLHNRNGVSLKVETTNFANNTTSNIYHSSKDKTPEI